jgi:exopolysaccharide biosynthesis predicted pyruvyltransferase EpsI
MNKQTPRHTDLHEQGVVSLKLLDLFQRFSDRDMFFIEPGGNFGDHLIYKGAYKLAKVAGLRYDILTFAEFEQRRFGPHDILYIHGGGGFVPWWSGKPMRMLKKLADEFTGTLIIGPTTFSQDGEYIKAVLKDCIGQNHFKELFMFTRDEVSLGIIQKYLPCQAQIACDHDTALNLVAADLLKGQAPVLGKYTLYAIRQDKERPADQPYNYFSWLDPIDVASSFEEWLNFHRRARKIITNRTHSTIVGTILGIPTVMLPNSYHKNRSVWEFSLRQRGVQWLDRIECGPLNQRIDGNNRLKELFTKRKYRKLLELRLNCLGF